MMRASPQVGRPTGGRQMITVQIVACVPAARDVLTLALAQPGTRRPPAPYLPGQFISLAFPAPTTTLYRSFSLSSDGSPDAPWEITVKRHHDGMVSNHIYRHARPGILMESSLPQGSFTLPPALRPGMPLVFVAGGSGISPFYGMLRALARLAPAQRPRVWLHYAYHSPHDGIYARELAALDPHGQWLTQAHYVSTAGQRLRVEQVVAALGALAPQTEWYVCGPAGLKRSLETVALHRGVPPARIHGEVFASPPPRAVMPPAPAGATRIRLADSGAVLEVGAGETLLETLERHGYRPSFECRAGTCGTCRLRLVAGRVHNGDGPGLGAADRAAGFVLSCTAQPLGEVTLATAGSPVVARPAGRAPARGGAPAGRPSKTPLRTGLLVASLGLFATAWSLTNHAPTTQAAGSNPSAPANSGGDNGGVLPTPTSGDDGGNGGIFGGNSGGGGIFGGNGGSISGQPGSGAPNTSSGTS